MVKHFLEKPLVSVVIPTYNRAELVTKTINSVLEQSYQNLEILLVDDGFIDNTEETIQNIADPRIRYLRHSTNKGGAAARNTGIEAAKGEYIAFLDSDDVWVSDKLELQLALIAIGWSHKYEMLFKDFGFDRFLVAPNTSLKSFVDCMEVLLDRFQNSFYRNQIHQKLQAMHSVNQDMWDKVTTILSEQCSSS